MFESLLNMISPSKGLDMLRLGIQKAIGKPVDEFTIIYIAESESLIFDVVQPDGNIKQPYTGSNKSMIIFAVKSLSSSKLKEGESLDAVKCHRLPTGNLNLEVLLTRNDKKEKIVIKDYHP